MPFAPAAVPSNIVQARVALACAPLSREVLLAWAKANPGVVGSGAGVFVLDWRYVRLAACPKDEAVILDIGEVLPGDRLADLRAYMETWWKNLARERPDTPVGIDWDGFSRGVEARYAEDPRAAAHWITDMRLNAARQHHLGTAPVTTDALMAWGEEKLLIELEAAPDYGACGCMGPSSGQPVCPCRMKNVAVMDDRWVQVSGGGGDMHLTDLGSVVSPAVVPLS